MDENSLIDEIIEEELEQIIKRRRISHDGKNFLVRIPREIEEFYSLEKGDHVEYKITITEEYMSLQEHEIEKTTIPCEIRIIKRPTDD